MKTVISVAIGLMCAGSLGAQIVVAANQLADGSTEIKIRNNSTLSLTTFAIRADVTADEGKAGRQVDRSPFVEYSDPVISPEIKPLLPNQERTVRILRCAGPLRNGIARCQHFEQPVAAGILADGSTTGDAELLSRLMLRRSNVLLSVETAIEMLSDAGKRNIPREQLVDQFRRMADFLGRWYLPPEQQIGRTIYQAIIGKLLSLPDGQLGEPFPPTAFVREETAMLNRQRVVLTEGINEISGSRSY